MWSLAKNWSILWIFSFISGAYLVVQKEDEQMMIFFLNIEIMNAKRFLC